MLTNKAKTSAHLFIAETESAKVNYKVEADDVLLDLKVLLRDYYTATFTKDEDGLKLQFTNGQKFVLSAKEV